MSAPTTSKPLTASLSFWLPALFSVVIAVSAHPNTLDQYPLFAYMVNLVALLVPSLQEWKVEQASQHGLLMVAWSWTSMAWLLIFMLPRYIGWRCKPDRFANIPARQPSARPDILGPLTTLFMAYLICFLAAMFANYAYHDSSFYNSTQFAKCTVMCSMPWIYFCLGFLVFSYAIPSFVILFLFITLDFKALLRRMKKFK